MNAVIARLLLRALPAPGGIRPRLANRFEGGPGMPDAEMTPATPLTATAATATQANDRAPAWRHPTRAAEIIAAPPGTAHARPAARENMAHDSEAPQPLVPRTFGAALEARSFSAPTPRIQGSPARSGERPLDSAQVPATAQRPPLLPPASTPAEFALAALPARPSNPAARQPPDVEISIGRIEVRAPRTQKIERAARARPQLMSLEDYLSRGRRPR